MPASTSSNTRVAGMPPSATRPSSNARRSANIDLANSPPEATLDNGSNSPPELAASMNRTSPPSSAPISSRHEPVSMCTRAFGMAKSRRRRCTAVANGPDVASRLTRTTSASDRTTASAAVLSVSSSRARWSWLSNSRNRSSASLRNAINAATSSPYLRCRSRRSCRRDRSCS